MHHLADGGSFWSGWCPHYSPKKVFNPQIVKEEALNAKRRRRPSLVTALTVWSLSAAILVCLELEVTIFGQEGGSDQLLLARLVFKLMHHTDTAPSNNES